MEEPSEGGECSLIEGCCDACVQDGHMVVGHGVEDVSAMQVAMNEVVPHHHLHTHVIQNLGELGLNCALLGLKGGKLLLAFGFGIVKVLHDVGDDLPALPRLHQDFWSHKV